MPSISPGAVTIAVTHLHAAAHHAAKADGCHEATGKFGDHNLPNAIHSLRKAADTLELVVIDMSSFETAIQQLRAAAAKFNMSVQPNYGGGGGGRSAQP